MKIDLNCERCGNHYQRVPSQASGSKFCTSKCHNASNAQAVGKRKHLKAMERRYIEVQPLTFRVFRLSQGQTVKVDIEDYEFAMSKAWFLHTQGYVAGNHGEYLHRMLWERIYSVSLTNQQVIDHKDHNKLNNRRSNLRLASFSTNGGNMLIPSHNTSGYKGVRFLKRYRMRNWIATIKVDQKGYHIGLFLTAEDAAYAYDQWAMQLFGEFARTNFDYV